MYMPEGLKEEIQRNILSRLRKIEGQVRGLQAMVTEDRECEEILIQVRAVQSALQSLSPLVLKSYLIKCYGDIGQNPNPEEMFHKLDHTVSILTKFIGG